MQKVGYGLADFCISWLRIGKNLERMNVEETLTDLTSELSCKLDARKAQIFDTPSMLAAMYLDPRIKHKLQNPQKECAILFLKKLMSRQQNQFTNQTDVNETLNNTLDELNEEFATMEGSRGIGPDESQLMASFAAYDHIQRVNIKDKVMDFWKTHKGEFPLIYSLACIIHAIPANQCLEERNFSSFSYIRSSRRTSLKPENVQNILTVRLNKELLYEQKQKDLDKILSKIF